MVHVRPLINLAPGIRLSGDGEPTGAMLCVVREGNVPLNRHALAVLELCDGTRSLDRVVFEAILRSAGGMHAADVLEFLDAARARGWVVESE